MEDGQVCLWQKAKKLAQILQGAPNGFSCLGWHPQGQQLAIGGQNGELLIWSSFSRRATTGAAMTSSKVTRGQGLVAVSNYYLRSDWEINPNLRKDLL